MSEHTNEHPPGGPYLRYYVPPDDREAHLDELIRTCEHLGIRDAFLFTTGYMEGRQFKDIADLEWNSPTFVDILN